MRYSRNGAVLLVLAALLLLAGCASVPSNSPARAVPAAGEATPSSPHSGPEPDASPLSLVRSYVKASANPHDDHAAARSYLAPGAAKSWNANKRIMVIADPFDTVPTAHADNDKNTRTVTLRGKDIGRLGSDGGFRPDAGDFEQPITLRKQPNGEWRISDPPPGVVVTLPDFLHNYKQVRVYFFDNRLGIPVPDLRYVQIGSSEQVAGEVIDLLLSGPSAALEGAVHSEVPRVAVNKGSVGAASDGALLVNLARLGEQSADRKRLIAQQIVLSLKTITNSSIRLQADGEPMLPEHPDWRPSDFPSYDDIIHPDSDSPGLVATGGQLVSLANGEPVSGSAGSSGAGVVTGAQAIDGTQLATVVKAQPGVELRVGRFGSVSTTVDITAGALTRPTWAPGSTSAGYSVWTVADGKTVYRVTGKDGGGWSVSKVDASALTQMGKISALRMSRDGVRVAAVVDGKLVVASVVRGDDGIRISGPQVLQGGSLTSVTGVAWQNKTTLVVATGSNSSPVVNVPVDGLQAQPYATANLTTPITAVTAAWERPVVVVDADGLWTSADVGAVWRPHTSFNPGTDAIPFYPG